MKIFLWIVQVVLAAVFLMAGAAKAFSPIEELIPSMAWMADVPAGLIRFIGWAEIVGAIGLILPAAFRIKPNLTPLAAAGISTIMVLAAGFHVTRGEMGDVMRNVVLLAVALFVVYGRLKKAPIQPR